LRAPFHFRHPSPSEVTIRPADSGFDIHGEIMRKLLGAIVCVLRLVNRLRVRQSRRDGTHPSVHRQRGQGRHAGGRYSLCARSQHHRRISPAFADWGKDFGTDAQKHGVTDPIVKLGKPKQIDITNDHAYVVIPASFAYKEHEKKVIEKGSTMTFGLAKHDGAWKIAARSWARN
jgi:hypothetical protein